jgi:peptide/nickel transport system permease protein
MEKQKNKIKTEKERSHTLYDLAWKRFKRNKLAVISVYVIVSVVLIAILGPFIRPDSSPKANKQHLEITLKPPGFEVLMIRINKNDRPNQQSFFEKLLWGIEPDYTEMPIYSYRFVGTKILVEKYTGKNPNNGAWLEFDLPDVVYHLKPGSPIVQNGLMLEFTTYDGEKHKEDFELLKKKILKNHIINQKFYFGTDLYGRDFLSRMMSGAWISLSVGFISVIISIVIGIFLGAVAGYVKGWVDDVIMWLINVVWSVPTLLFIIAITLVIGKDFWQVFVAVGLTMWVEVARVVRGQVLSIREKEFVEAGKALGYNDVRILFRHILPNVMGPVIVISAANFASAILIEAGLSFLGLGAAPPQATWGKIISEHRGYMFSGAGTEYLTIIPGLAIMILVLAFIFIGNGLRDALDAKASQKFSSA